MKNPETQMHQSDYTLSELVYYVRRYGQRSVDADSLRKWFRPALIAPRSDDRPLYGNRDLAKLIFIARCLNRVRSLQTAQSLLLQDLEANPHKYEEPNHAGITIDIQSHA